MLLITSDAQGYAKGAVWIERKGARHYAKAAATIFCANGIGTPRLLLMSGLGNSSGLVGRKLMMHPFATVMGTFEEDLESRVWPAGQILVSMEFRESDARRRAIDFCKRLRSIRPSKTIEDSKT